jgi:hypothetical protein
VRALVLEAALEGEEDKGGAVGFGGGGNVVFAGEIGDSGGNKAGSDSGDGGSLRSRCGRRLVVAISGQEVTHIATGKESGLNLPSTVRLNSTARVSPTNTYSRLSNPSSSDSPGMTDPSVEIGFEILR